MTRLDQLECRHATDCGGASVAVEMVTAARPTLDDVAGLAGVSTATASRALRDLPSVTVTTRRRVRAAAKKLGYVPDLNAARLRSGRSRTIGLVAPLLTSWYSAEVAAGVEVVLNHRGYDLLLATSDIVVGSSPSDSPGSVDRVNAFRQRVDGLVLVGEGRAQSLADVGLPAVVVGDWADAMPSFSVDNELGGELAGRHLLSLGHRRIGVLGGAAATDPDGTVAGRRLSGYLAALRSARVRRNRQLEFDAGFSMASARTIASRVLAGDDRPTALFCLSDEMAFGAMQVARELGIGVPTELSIIGFDDHSISEAFGLTTIRQPVREMGEISATVLIDMLENGAEVRSHQTIGISLVVRASTAPPHLR